MKSGQKTINIYFFISCIFMMLTLTWLTVSLPFVNAAQQTIDLNKSADTSTANNDEEGNNGLPNNTTEEKTSGSANSIAEEYLHDTHSSEQYLTVPSIEYKVEHVSTYIAFHGELISPPPDACWRNPVLFLILKDYSINDFAIIKEMIVRYRNNLSVYNIPGSIDFI